jgi:CRISPR-associated exonuclease Cas4
MRDGFYLQVTDLKQYVYCPRVVFYRYCLPDIRPVTFKMQAGIAAQERVNDLEKRRSLRAYDVVAGTRHFHVSVVSERLKLTGQIDLVVAHGEGDEERLIPVDFKLSRRKPGPHFKLQLGAYGVMLAEAWNGVVDVGYLYQIPTKTSVQVPITSRLRKQVESTGAEIHRMIDEERMPGATSQPGKCVNCEFRRFCNDVG